MVYLSLCFLHSPSSEKLLSHPFFKQAKKPEWLAKNIIADIPPIETRPIKKFPHKKVSSTSTDEWDFNDEQDTPIQQIPGLHAPKRHISFGHVVVRKPSSHAASESWSYSPSKDFSLDTVHNITSPPRKGRALSDDFIIESSVTEDKRGRFNLKHSRVRHGSLHERAPTVTFSEDPPAARLLHRTISHDDNMSKCIHILVL